MPWAVGWGSQQLAPQQVQEALATEPATACERLCPHLQTVASPT